MYWMKIQDLYKRVNKQLVSMEPVTDKYDVLELKEIITGTCGIYQFKEGQGSSGQLWRIPSEV